MAAPDSNLTRKQEDAIIALLSNSRIEDAARVAGVGARTLMRWLKEPVFEKAYMKARLNQGAKAIEIEDIDARVSELERAAEQARPSGR